MHLPETQLTKYCDQVAFAIGALIATPFLIGYLIVDRLRSEGNDA